MKPTRQEIIQYVRDHKDYLERNHVVYDIFTGNLLPYVTDVLEKTLSANYYNKIKERIVPVNVLERYVKKVSSAYENPPKRICKNESDQEVVDYYVREMALNQKFASADQYCAMFKGYGMEPYVDQGQPKCRVMPFDRFIVYSDNTKDPTTETVFIKITNKQDMLGNNVECYYVYTNEAFDAFDANGKTIDSALEGNDGVNPFEVIPLLYGKRSENELLPVQDTDIVSMAKLISVFMSDLSGVSMFQCFSIIYGIDLSMDNIVMAPNALWNFKSDASRPDAKPSIGTIKPEADIDKVLNFIITTFVLWLETKGIRVGSIGSIDAGNSASGIAKIIDEMDVYKVVKESIQNFEREERTFWKKMVKIHNEWLAQGEISGMGKLSEDFDIQIIFPEPQPKRNKIDVINEKKTEVDAGFKSRKKAMMELNPEMSETEIDEEILAIDDENVTELPEQQGVNGQV